MIAVTHVDDELGREQPERARGRRRQPPQDALLAIGREADRQRLDAERGRRDDDQRRDEDVDAAQAAEGRIRLGRRTDPKISRMTDGRAMAASQVIGLAEQQLRLGDDERAHLVHDSSFAVWAQRGR